MKVRGLDSESVDVLIVKFIGYMHAAMSKTLKTATEFALVSAGSVNEGPSTSTFAAMDAVATIQQTWGEQVSDNLGPELAQIFFTAAKTVHGQVSKKVTTNVASAKMSVGNTSSFMKNAIPRLNGFSTELWEVTQRQVTLGLQDGESMKEIAQRIVDVAEIKAAKAHVIAQTLVVGAVNGGEYEQMKSLTTTLGVHATKQWEATEDAHTRPTHHKADGQSVQLDGHFQVGEGNLLFPGDPTGPPSEVINCRCSVLYDIDVEDDLQASGEPIDYEKFWTDALPDIQIVKGGIQLPIANPQSIPGAPTNQSAVATNGALVSAVNAEFNAQHPRGKDGKFIKKGTGLPGILVDALKLIRSGKKDIGELTEGEKVDAITDLPHITPKQWVNLKDEDKAHLQKLAEDALDEGVPGSAAALTHLDDLEQGGAQDETPDVFNPATVLPAPQSAPTTTVAKATPIKITHGLIHAKHTPGEVIAQTKDKNGVNVRVKWTGSEYKVELQAKGGSWLSSTGTTKKKSQLYAYLAQQYPNAKWTAPGKQDVEVNAPSLNAPTAPSVKPSVPHPVKDVVAPASASGTNPFVIIKNKGKSGDGFVAPNIWGKYGAAGVMIRAKGEDGQYRYLLVQRGKGYDNELKWQLPGGAIDEFETPEQGAAREIFEEIGAPQSYLETMQHRGTHAVNVDIGKDKPWTYSNIAADAPTMFKPKIDGTETNDARWLTKDEIDQMLQNGELHKPFAAQLDKVFGLWGGNKENETEVDVPNTPDVVPTSPTDPKPSTPELTKDEIDKAALLYMWQKGLITSQEYEDQTGEKPPLDTPPMGNAAVAPSFTNEDIITYWPGVGGASYDEGQVVALSVDGKYVMKKGMKNKFHVFDAQGDLYDNLSLEDVKKGAAEDYTPGVAWVVPAKPIATKPVGPLQNVTLDQMTNVAVNTGKLNPGDVVATGKTDKFPTADYRVIIQPDGKLQYQYKTTSSDWKPMNPWGNEKVASINSQKIGMKWTPTGTTTAVDVTQPGGSAPSLTPSPSGAISTTKPSSQWKSIVDGAMDGEIVAHGTDQHGHQYTVTYNAATDNFIVQSNGVYFDEQSSNDVEKGALEDGVYAGLTWSTGALPSVPISTPAGSPAPTHPKTGIAHVSSYDKAIFYDYFKAEKVSPAWSGAKIYNSIQVAKNKMGGNPVIAALSDEQMLQLVDEKHKNLKYDNPADAYSKKVIDWLKTPNGKKAATAAKSGGWATGHASVPTPAVKKTVKKAASAPSLSHAPAGSDMAMTPDLLDGVSPASLSAFYKKFKSKPFGTSISNSPIAEVYANAVQIAHDSQASSGLINGDINIGKKLTAGDVLRLMDEETKKLNPGSEATYAVYEQKVADWLKTPSGQTLSADIKKKIAAGTYKPHKKAAKKSSYSYGASTYGSSYGGSYTHDASKPYSQKVQLKGDQIEDFDTSKGPSDFPVISTSQGAKLWADMEANDGGPITAGQKASLKYYTSNAGYTAMNRYLRGKQGATDATQNHIDKAQDGMRRLTQDVTLHRGAGFFTGWGSYAEIKANEGKVWHEPAFFSASVNGKSAFGGQIAYIIEAPKGTPGAFVKAFSNYGSENELFLAAGLKYQIISVENKGSPTTSGSSVTVRLRVVPDHVESFNVVAAGMSVGSA